MTRTGLLAPLLLLAMPLGAHPVQAQGIDLSHGGPIAITAKDGIEWLQAQHEVIASGSARAVRQNVTVIADRLIAFYRKKQGVGGTAAASASTAPKATPTSAARAAGPLDINGDEDASGNEIYRMEAIGHVVIFTPTDRAQGERAVYDLDQAVLVMTGHDLRLTTPNDVLTARDDLEYWSLKHMAVARGDAVLVTKDHRRVAADVLVAYTTPANQQPSTQPAKPAASVSPASEDPLEASGRLRKVEAFGNVTVSTPTEVVTGDRGVYVPETGIAILLGQVRITRGQNQLNGAEAEVNLKTGISRLLPARSGRVQGLIVPNQAQPQGQTHPTPQAGSRKP